MTISRRMLSLSPSGSRVFDYSIVALRTLIVAVVDYVTGTEVHVLALYFVPLAFAGWRLGQTGAGIGPSTAQGAESQSD